MSSLSRVLSYQFIRLCGITKCRIGCGLLWYAQWNPLEYWNLVLWNLFYWHFYVKVASSIKALLPIALSVMIFVGTAVVSTRTIVVNQTLPLGCYKLWVLRRLAYHRKRVLPRERASAMYPNMTKFILKVTWARVNTRWMHMKGCQSDSTICSLLVQGRKIVGVVAEFFLFHSFGCRVEW